MVLNYKVVRMIEDANKLLDDKELMHDSLVKFVEIMKSEINKSTLTVVKGI